MYDIDSLKRKMLIKYPFFGSTITNVEYQELLDIDTAATDGNKIYYNPEFLGGLTIEEQIFILAHEVCHIAFNHISRRKDKDKNLWNIATDAVINQLLKKDGLKMLDGLIDIPEAIDYDAETYYEKLLQGQKENPDFDRKAGNDSHEMWENTDIKEIGKTDALEKEDDISEKDAFKKNRELKKKQLEDLKRSLIKDTVTSNEFNMSNIGSASSLIDWRYILKETINYDVDWSYKNATIENGVITANLEDKALPVTEILLDTSGSINEDLLRTFLRECKNILKHSKVLVGCFDTIFYGFKELRTEQDIDNMRFVGGGGTNFDVAVGAFSRRSENKIIFTDGEARMPITPVNAVWIVFGNRKINPKGGKVIYINEELYNNMNVVNKKR